MRAVCTPCTSAFPPVQNEYELLVHRLQDTESSLQAVRSDSAAKEGNMQSALDTAQKDRAALMDKNEQLSAELQVPKAPALRCRLGPW